MEVKDELIDRSAGEGARIVALIQLGACDDAAAVLAGEEEGDGPEALHDFRVALRRLRSLLRAFRPFLTRSIRPEDERRLRRLASRTNAARDAEVQLAWLDRHASALSARGQPGLDLLRARYAGRTAGEGAEVGALVARYRRLAERLARRLDRFEGRISAERGPSFGEELALLLQAHLGELAERLASVQGSDDEERAHRARIAGKRLRYLLEPLRDHPQANASRAVRRLKGLQDLLGELHDRHVLGAEIAGALGSEARARARAEFAKVWHAGQQLRAEEVGRPVPGSRLGMLAVLREVRRDREALWEKLAHQRDRGLSALSAELGHLVRQLTERAGLEQAPVELPATLQRGGDGSGGAVSPSPGEPPDPS